MSMNRKPDSSAKTKATDEKKPSKWKTVRLRIPDVLEYGREVGILAPLPMEASDGAAGLSGMLALGQDEPTQDRLATRTGDKVKLPTNDISLSHEAIPFLPLPIAIFCFVMNLFVAGSGTFLSGIFGMAIGQPRVKMKEGRELLVLIINTGIGISQFMTVTFFLVGWGWSVAWGGLMIVHSLAYRRALIARRKEAVATAAIEALTKDSVMHRRDVQKLL